MIVLAVGFYGFRWVNRYVAAREDAKPVNCEFHQEVPLVKLVEDTEEIINTAICPSELDPEALWRALTDFRARAEPTYLASSVEYARHLYTPKDLKTISERWPKEIQSAIDLSPIKLGSPEQAYIYLELKQINLVFTWTILSYRTRLANEAERVYRLDFKQPDNMGSLLFYRGHFRLESNPAGKGTRITYVLRQAMPNRLSGEGLLGMASRMMIMNSYLEGFHPYMEEVVAGVEHLAMKYVQAENIKISSEKQL
jgi:hypothetical protein